MPQVFGIKRLLPTGPFWQGIWFIWLVLLNQPNQVGGKAAGAATDEDTADSADVERHCGSLIVTQDIKFHCLLVAELLE